MTANTILVVDDEPMVVALTRQALAHQGYKVLCATDPRQALELVQSGPPVDLVVSDVVMPIMRGPELIQAIRQLSPGTAAILMSGYVGAEGLPPGIPFLQKPVSLPKLVSTVERALASRKSRGLQPGREKRLANKDKKRTA